MATTKRGIRYPYGEDYDLDADVPEDLKKMAESTDEAIDDVEKNLEEKLGTYENTYDSTETYSIGSIVVYDKKIYECLQETTGEFDTTKWQEVTVKELIDKVEEITTDIEEEQATQNESIEELKTRVTELNQENEDLKNNQLTNIPPPATSHYLQDSADSRFRKFIPIGRTTQESDPTPENPVPIKNTGDNVNEFDKDDTTKILDMYINPSNNLISSSSNAKSFYIECEKNKEYTISRKAGQRFVVGTTTAIPTSGMTVNDKVYDMTADKLTIKTGSNDNYIICFYYLSSADTLSEEEIRNSIKVEKGTKATPYSPYGCGNVNEKIENFNIWDEELERGKINVTTGENASSSDNMRSKNFIPINSSFTYYLYNGSLLNVASSRMLGFFYDKDKNYISNTSVNNTTFVTPTNAKYLRFFCAADYGINYKNDICINVSNSALNGTYVPHSEQNISFPLAQGQKFYEGSHPADDEKVHHKWGEVVLDGTENWEQTSTATSGKYRWLLNVNNVKATSSTSEIPEIFSTHYKAVAFGGGNGTYNNVQGISVANYGSKIGIYDNTYNTDLNAWKAYLAEQYANGTPVRVVYQLAEEQKEDFTEEQQTAWEQIKKARTYKNITHISSEDETPANVEIEYVVDINTIDDRITALEAKVDLLEE